MSETTEFKFSPLQEKWLQALESGEWKQCGGAVLRNDEANAFCCLGVACEVAGLERLDDGVFKYRIDNENKTGVGSLGEFHKVLGLRDGIGELAETAEVEGRSHRYLAFMNDRGVPFKTIAAYIRANPRNVFTEPSQCSPQ